MNVFKVIKTIIIYTGFYKLLKEEKKTGFKKQLSMFLLLIFTSLLNLFAQDKAELFSNDKNVQNYQRSSQTLSFLGDFWQKTNLPYSNWVVCMSMNSSDHLFAGTRDGGIFRSTNLGSTWTQNNNGLSNLNIYSLTIAPNGNMFAGTTSGGIFKSTDYGNSWTISNTGVTSSIVWAMTVNSSGFLYAGLFGNGVYRSTNNGSSWTSINSGLTDLLVMSLYVNSSGYIFAGTSTGKLHRSTDGGSSWALFGTGLPAKAVMCISSTTSGIMFLGTDGAGLYKSIDGGNTWIQSGIGISNSTIESIQINNNGNIFAGTVAGLFYSTDNGSSWVANNTGLINNYIYSFALTSTGFLFAGTGNDIYKSVESTNAITTPLLISPPNSLSGLTKNTELIWSAVNGAISYQVQVSTDSLFGNKIYDQAITGSNTQINGLNDNTKYFWRVRANFTASVGQWSGIFNFTTGGSSPDDIYWDARFLPANSVDGGSYAIEVIGNDVFVAGYGLNAGSIPASHVAKWDGNVWSALGAGTDDRVYAMASSGTDLYVGGLFSSAGGLANTRGIAKWNNSTKTWSALGTGTNGQVNSILVSGGYVYISGSFSTAGGATVNNIAKWNGSVWIAMGTGANSSVTCLTAGADGSIYAGGSFTTIGGVSANRIAKWNGSSWSALGTGLDNMPWALTTNGNEVYAGGDFHSAGGVAVNHVAKWNGSSWSALGNGVSDRITAAASSGSNIYFGGWFDLAGNIPNTSHIAKWDGTAWSSLGSGVNDRVFDINIQNSDVWACGNFTIAGGKSSNFMGRYGAIVAQAVITLDKNKLPFSAQPNSALPASQIVNISNSGSGSFGWNLSNSSSWLSVNPKNGTGNSTITIGVNTTNLAPNIYIDTIIVNSVNASNSPQKIIITYTVSGSLPAIISPVVSNITSNSALVGATVSSDGGSPIADRGIVWALTSNPTISDNKITSAGTTGIFTLIISGLTPSTTYHFRGYAKNSGGTAYTDDVIFTTSGALPVVTTLVADNIGSYGVRLNGNVNPNDRSATVIFEYGTTSSYGSTINASPNIVNVNQKVYSDLAGLLPSTLYHYRIKAVNSTGTSVGEDITFTTLGLVPLVENTTITDLTISSAVLGGNVISANGSIIVERGIVYSLNTNPTVEADKQVIVPGELASFTANVTGLQPNTRYHYRTYAKNLIGYGYSRDTFFNTNSTVPTAITLPADSILSHSATLNGKVNANGILSNIVFEYGLTTVYGNTISAIPASYNGLLDKTVIANVTNLKTNTTYHYRIKAIYFNGTSFGSDESFTTSDSIITKVVFNDINLENEIRNTLKKPTGDITENDMLSLATFSAQNKNISDIRGLEYAKNLDYLNLMQNNISDISPLTALVKIINLYLIGNRISDISSLKNLTNLAVLSLSQNNISDISFLSGLTKLSRLDLDGNVISDISTISDLKGLYSLNLTMNKIKDITPLKYLTNLNTLYIHYNQITDISPLGNLTRLQNLLISRNNILDLSILQSLANLKQLDISNNAFEDIKPISYLINLTDLYIGNNKLTDVHLPNLYPLKLLSNNNLNSLINGTSKKGYLDLRGNIGFSENAIRALDEQLPLIDYEHILWDTLKTETVRFIDSKLEAVIRNQLGKPAGIISEIDMLNLTALDIENKGISNLTGLEYAKNLISLNARTNSIVDISPLKDLTNLVTLIVGDNQIQNISSINKLTKIIDLRIFGNKINDISVLSNLINLEGLDANHNEINDISALSGLTKLRGLHIFVNKISDIRPVSNLTELTALNLSNNSISDISALSGLTKLEFLYIHDNQIVNLLPLQNLVNLKQLELYSNQITDITIIKNIINLQYLNLTDNKISDIGSLNVLVNLSTLNLGVNLISDISSLSNLRNVRTLTISSNLVTDINPLKNLSSLNLLNLRGNRVSNISALSNLPLTDLIIKDNLLDTNDLPDLYNLKTLSNNIVQTVIGNNTLSGYLDLRGNSKMSVSAINRLAAQLPLIAPGHILFDTVGIIILPEILSVDSSQVSASSAVLTAKVNAKGIITNVWFEYGIKSDLSIYDSTQKKIIAQPVNVIYKDTVMNLLPSLKYYFRFVAESGGSRVKSAIYSLITRAGQAAQINLSANALTFSANRNGILPEKQTITLTNGGTGPLNWTAETDLNWLEISPKNGSGAATITIAINTTALTADKNNGKITFRSAEAMNSPKNLDIIYNLLNITIPKLNVSIDSRSAEYGKDKTIIFNLIDGATPKSVTAFYRVGGDTKFDSLQTTFSNNIYSFIIPGGKISERGIDFYLKTYFDGMSTTITEKENKPVSVRVKINRLDSTFKFIKNKYSFISVPDYEGTTLMKEIEREIGGQNKEVWRIFKWKIDKYEEYLNDNNLSINVGDGCWFISSMNKTSIGMNNIFTYPTNEPVKIILQPGWNQIGNPFLFEIAATNLIRPVNKRIEKLWSWNNTKEEYYPEENIIQPWTGFFIQNLESDTVSVYLNPVKYSSLSFAKSSEENHHFDYTKYNEKGWKIELNISTSENNQLKIINPVPLEMGCLENSSDSWDYQDLSLPPGKPNKLDKGCFYFRTDAENSRYLRDYRLLDGKGKIWRLEIENTQETGNKILIFKKSVEYLENAILVVYDCDLNIESKFRITDWINDNIYYKVPYNEKLSVRKFRITIGNESFTRDDIGNRIENYILQQNYPNPFNPTTKIGYVIPEDDFVIIKIHNSLGQEIETLISSYHKKGSYNVDWYPKECTSGIYFYSLHTSHFYDMKKMLYLR